MVIKFLILIAVLFLVVLFARAAPPQTKKAPRISPADAAARVKTGNAVLIDVREPSEWNSGVAAPAYLLPLSDLRGNRAKWAHVLDFAKANQSTLLLYCHSGARSGEAAAQLASEGFTVANLGGFRDWRHAKLPIRAPNDPAANE